MPAQFAAEGADPSMGSSPGYHDYSNRRTASQKWWNSGLVWAAIGGIAAVLSVVVALVQLYSSAPAGSSNVGPSTSTSSTAEIDANPSTTPPPTSATTNSTLPTDPTEQLISTTAVEVEVEYQRYVDLDTGAQLNGDPWNAPAGSDLSFGNFGRVEPVKPARLHLLFQGTTQRCNQSEDSDPNGIDEVFADDLSEGDSLCVITDEGNVALLKVTRAVTGKYFEGGIEFAQELYSSS